MSSKSNAIQISIAACFEKQAKDQIEQTSNPSYSECDPLDNNDNSETNEDFDLDDSASAIDLDNM